MITLSPQDRDAAIRIILGEARNQGDVGMAAVTWTIRHRAFWDQELSPDHPEHEWWGNGVWAACLHPWQYSCNNGGANTDFIKGLATDDPLYIHGGEIVDTVFALDKDDLTGGSTTYKVRGTKASWDDAVAGTPPREIGVHDFWRLSPSGECLPFLDS